MRKSVPAGADPSRMRTLASLFLAALAIAVLPQPALARDSDRDGLPDRWERQNRLSIGAKSANGDVDRDGVDNRNELREGTRPRVRDTDHDGRPDGLEDRDRDGLSNAGEDFTGNDPRRPDTDGDGVRDGQESAGVVSSFDGEVLVVELAGGGTVSGLVTPDTELECERENSLESHYARPGKRGAHRRRKGRGRHRGSARRAVASSLGPDDESSEDEEDLEDELDEEDELDDEEYEDDYEDDEDFDDEDEDEAGHGSCRADALEPGARVHEAELYLSEAGLEFEYLALVR